MSNERAGVRSRIAFVMMAPAVFGAIWVAACGDDDIAPKPDAGAGAGCTTLTCPAGFDPDVNACTCHPAATNKCATVSCAADQVCNATSGQCEARCAAIKCAPGATADPATCTCQAAKCAAACTAGQACNPKTGACEASPGGGVIRTDLVNKDMSVGIHNNGGDVPQGIREAHLDFNWQASQLNSIVAVAVAPGSIKIDGKSSSATEWQGVPVSTLSGMARGSQLIPVARRTNGTATNMTTEDFGVTQVKVAAAYDGASIYFRFEWADDTQNDVRGRWVWNGMAWARDTAATQPLPAGNRETARAVTANEDRLQVLFNMNIPNFFGDNAGLGSGCASLCHLEGKNGQRIATASVDGGTTFYTGSGLMHTNAAGQKVDLWHWKATRSNALRMFDDQVIDEGSRHGDANQSDDFSLTAGSCTRKNTDPTRYSGVDAGNSFNHFTNEYFASGAPGCASLGPSRLPTPYASGVTAMYEDNSPFIGTRGTASRTDDGTATPTTGDTIPGFIFRTVASTSACQRCQNEAEGFWSNNTWVLEIRRSLVAPDVDDVDFTRAQ